MTLLPRTLSRSVLAAAGLLLAAAPALATNAVWLSRGNERGQGSIFWLDGRCLVVTAGHVLGKPEELVKVVDAERNSADARTLTVDGARDLGLAEVPDPRGAGKALCARKPQRMAVWPREAALAAGGTPTVWLSKVNSASGELGRFNLEARRDGPAGRLHVARSNLPTGQADPAPGDSGAPVWMATGKLDPKALYDKDGRPRPNLPGQRALLGVYLGRSGELSVLAAGDAVRDFVLQALEPAEPGRITLKPEGVTLQRALRGEFAADESKHWPSIEDATLQTLSMELDLGRRENVVSAVTVTGTPPSAQAARGGEARRIARMTVYSSAYRPGEDGVRWTREARCSADRNRAVAAVVRCSFPSPKVVRGLRVEIEGGPSTIAALEVELQPR